jgi:hypothetical protein
MTPHKRDCTPVVVIVVVFVTLAVAALVCRLLTEP